ncbi:hypothetical protein RUM44_009358 [Polyplax serrata]|uniref:Uncharacterized protein n=1 Tax=Polyplax serrata TaxID=468196 RepID=A0ABR1ASF5_POLSC
MRGLFFPANIEDLFQKALINQMYLCRVQAIVDRMSKHPDFTTRLLLVKKLPRLAMLCFLEDKPQYVSIHLCPLLLSCLIDKNEEVRKAGEISLTVIIKRKLLERETIDDKVCPWVVEICKNSGYASTVAVSIELLSVWILASYRELTGCQPSNMPALMSRKLFEIVWLRTAQRRVWSEKIERKQKQYLGPKLMGKMAPLIGKEATEKYFLDVFVHLCSNEGYKIRIKCVKSLGEMSVVLGTETTEKYLLNPFIKLCRDESWMVRFCCPEVAIPVSCTCSLTTRKTVLASAFADLLKDTEDCIRMSAYGFLGAFICTFADPSVTKLDYDRNGKLIFVGEDGCEFRLKTVHYSVDMEFVDEIEDGKQPYLNKGKGDQELDISAEEWLFGTSDPRKLNFQREPSNPSLNYLVVSGQQPTSGVSWSTSSNENNRWNKNWNSAEEEEADELYNTFRFWRAPLYELDAIETEPEQDEILTNLKILDNEIELEIRKQVKLAECSEEMKSLISCASSSDSGWNSAETTPHVESMASSNPKTEGSEVQSPSEMPSVELSDQEVVPQVLLDSFVAMTSNLKDEFFEKEVAQDCAYCLPAVALTLGPSNWPYIRNAFKCLTMNIQWKVRKTVVSSIHKVASLVGEEIASRDLAPIFESSIKDLDEVKVGAVEHLADFLKLVQPETRKAFLPRLRDFLETEFDFNWRYREEFGEQLRLLIKLFGPSDWLEFFKPLATLLLCDKVAAVRQKAVSLFLELIVNLSSEPEYQDKLLRILVSEFASNPSWRRRQIFVHLCSEVVSRKALNEKSFCNFLLEPLILLQNDTVPNVRLCVARCLSCDIVSTGYIFSSSPHYKSILSTLETLKRDSDSDIRFFASKHESQEEEEVSKETENEVDVEQKEEQVMVEIEEEKEKDNSIEDVLQETDAKTEPGNVCGDEDQKGLC